MNIETRLRSIIDGFTKVYMDLESDMRKPVANAMGEKWDMAGGYIAFADAIHKLESEQLIEPVKASSKNGMKPQLYLRYRKLYPKKQDYGQAKLEMLTYKSSQIDMGHFLNAPDEYEEVRDVLLAIDRYLVDTRDTAPKVWDTVNERSFMLTGHEKYLSSANGRRLLKLIGIDLRQLHCTPTPEPFFNYPTDLPQNGRIDCLVVENKDTFYTFKNLLKNHLLDFSPPIQLLIYGEGKKILSSWPFIFECQPLHDIRFYYYGDLDPEGASICSELIEATSADADLFVETLPSQSLHTLLLETGKTRKIESNQARVRENRYSRFMQYFNDSFRNKLASMWQQQLFIPQEAVPASVLAEKGRIEL